MNDKRFIEQSFPVKEISEISAKEKNIRHGHISTLHIWWARRPLAASRATVYASLIPATDDPLKWQEKRNFIIDLSKWENSNRKDLIEKAIKEIIDFNNGENPKAIDPFSGGGSYPLEALRLGCHSCANDYNPVAVLILKAVLEFPQKYSRPFDGMPDFNKTHKLQSKKNELGLDIDEKIENPLLFAVEYWGNWVLEEAKKELSDLYKSPNKDETPVGYIWARTVPCQNPSCGVEIPLMRQYWLSNKDKRKIALYPFSKGTGKPINFKIVAKNISGYEPWPEGLNPEEGTVSRANVRCPSCGSMIDDKTTRKLFQTGKSGERMVAVVYTKDNEGGKHYRLATEEDINIFKKAQKKLDKKIEELREKWMIEPVPDEELPLMSGVFNVPIYGYNKWGMLFNPRQKLSILTFVDIVRRSYEKMISLGYNEDFAKAIVSYIALLIDRVAAYNCSLVPWQPNYEKVQRVFSRQALGMIWDYTEINVAGNVVGSYYNLFKDILEFIMYCSFKKLYSNVSQYSAINLAYDDNSFDAVFTDPPYYNSVPYADLSDFFYVWLKRTIGHLFPELFSTPLTPKTGEITEMAGWDSNRYAYKDKHFFEEQLALSFKEIYRILKPGGIAVIVYAHKSTSGWETVINALLDSGLVITASWPINTEMKSRLRAKESAALGSSIYIVVRKFEKNKTGFYNEVYDELKKYLNEKLDRLWDEGISGADFFISAIGAGIEVFGKYEKIMDYSGNIIRADKMIEDIRKISTDYAVHKILHNGFAGEINDLTRFYVLWRWEYGESIVVFDEARKLATTCGIDLSDYWQKEGFIKKEKENIIVLGPEDRKIEELKKSEELIDVLHYVLLLWEKGEHREIIKHLSQSKFGKSEAFYRVAQAIAESLPNESSEKKLLEGFLTGKEKLIRELSDNEGGLFK